MKILLSNNELRSLSTKKLYKFKLLLHFKPSQNL